MTDRIVGVASVVALISLFLPWFTVTITLLQATSLGVSAGSALDSGSTLESGTSAHGWLWFAFIVGLVIVAYLVLMTGFSVLPFRLTLPCELVLLGAVGLNLLLVFIGFLLKPGTGVARIGVGRGIGTFLALIAAVVTVAALVLARRPAQGPVPA